MLFSAKVTALAVPFSIWDGIGAARRAIRLSSITHEVVSDVGQDGFMLSSVSANSGSTMVWSRSGPVETIPIFAPLSRS